MFVSRNEVFHLSLDGLISNILVSLSNRCASETAMSIGLRCIRNFVSSPFSMDILQAATGERWDGWSCSMQEQVGRSGGKGRREDQFQMPSLQEQRPTSRRRDSVCCPRRRVAGNSIDGVSA